MTKIIDLLQGADPSKPHVSIEFFPPRTDDGVKHLYARMDRMKENMKPLFTDMTWGAGGSTADISLDLSLYAQKTGHVSNLHLTCTNLSGDEDPKEAIYKALKSAYEGGIRNIVALRGDPAAGQEEWKASEEGFTCALDLVEFIKLKFGDDFGISVAGYPEGHPNAISEVTDPSSLTVEERTRASCFDGITYCCLEKDYQTELEYLKRKVDAGADLIITQMFFDAKVFIKFVEDCRRIGIACPIVPGLMCINNYPGFVKMTKFCKTRVPDELQAQMEAVKDDAIAMKQFGIDFGVRLCKELIASGHVQVLHFYTLNLEKVVYGVLDGLGMTLNASAAADEKDAASMIAKGSAWARVGDKVKTQYGEGVVAVMDQVTGNAEITIDSWFLAGKQHPVAFLQKGQFEKLF